MLIRAEDDAHRHASSARGTDVGAFDEERIARKAIEKGLIQTTDGIAVLTLTHGKANTLDLEFCQALAARYAQAGWRLALVARRTVRQPIVNALAHV